MDTQTHPPLWPAQVQNQVNCEIARLVAWSLRCASNGIAPSSGFRSEIFHKNSYRSQLAGKVLANGWRILCWYMNNCFFPWYVWSSHPHLVFSMVDFFFVCFNFKNPSAKGGILCYEVWLES